VKVSQPPELVLVLDLSASLYIGLLDPRTGLLASRIREQASRGESAGRGETGHELLEECLTDSGAKLTDIGSICIGTGPGSFTGIRIGVAIAQGLGFARQLPLYPYSSLAALSVCASLSPNPASKTPVAAIDAIAAIAANAGRYFILTEELGQVLISGDELAALGALHPTLITSGRVPDGDRFRNIFSTLERMEDRVDFLRIADLARVRPPILDGIIRPNYLQVSAAEEKRRSPGTGGIV
jgi:tRNA threonylcarbamoyl adenosine modification protein YeaZ